MHSITQEQTSIVYMFPEKEGGKRTDIDWWSLHSRSYEIDRICRK